MVGAIILIGLVLGAALACAAAKVPAHAVALERCGGALLVASLALLGGSLNGCAFAPQAALSAQSTGSLPTTAIGANRDTIIPMAAQHRLPAIYSDRNLAAAGSYGSNNADQYRRAASYVDRILRGAKVSELPVLFPTKFELVINLKTAKAIGLTIPETFLVRADEVIE